jgi:Fe-Mn family superoxide dismutase
MPEFSLPELAYDYSALEPHISGKIMELHHDKHHKKYVEGANEAKAALKEARARGNFDKLSALQHLLSFNLSGHVLHSIFWSNLSPDGGGEPDGELLNAVKNDFGSFATFKKQLTALAASITGSGWAALVWDPIGQCLSTSQIHDHQSEILQGSTPLLVLDAWEHAYYLQYQTDKAKYFEAIWNVWNWDDVAARLRAAQRVNLSIGLTSRPEAAAPSAEAAH